MWTQNKGIVNVFVSGWSIGHPQTKKRQTHLIDKIGDAVYTSTRILPAVHLKVEEAGQPPSSSVITRYKRWDEDIQTYFIWL